MMYPMDPNGPLGHEYPPGFTKWYFLIIVAVVVIGYYALGGN